MYLPRGWQDYPLELAFCPSKKAYYKAVEEYDVGGQWSEYNCPPMGGLCVKFTGPKISPIILVMVGSKQLDPKHVRSIIVHESVHAWQYVADCLGVVNADPETEAYSITGIYNFMLGSWNDTVGKKHGIHC